jgi:peptidyl-prolyl cis-trans isomerase A (cyclophilin A)
MRKLLTIFAVLTATANAGAFPQSTHPAMLDPSKATTQAPETYKAKFETTQGDVVFECTRAWAPHGVDRFYNLVRIGFFDDVALFRVSKGFVVQWGIHGDPKVAAVWQSANIEPDPPKQSNTRGMLTFAMAGGSNTTRSTQLFINFGDNSSLDGQGFAPICKVSEGMDVADKFYSEYGERVTGKQGQIVARGNAYLKEAWPSLDYIKKATIVGEALDPQRGSKPDDKTATTNEEAAAKDESSPVPWIIGLVVVVGLGAYFLRGKKEEPAPPPTKKEGKKKKKKKS